MTMKKVDRRAWMSGMGAVAAGMALGQTSAAAQEPVVATARTEPFQPTRHPQDAWFDALPGQHRVIFDVTSATGTPEGIGYATNTFNANRSGYELQDSDLAVVVCLRHLATAFAFNNDMWAKYGAALASAAQYKGSGDQPPTSNPHNSGNRAPLDRLASRGTHFAVCQLATGFFARAIAGRDGDSEAVLKELMANAIPNAHFMAAGVVAVARAQEYGYSVLYVG